MDRFTRSGMVFDVTDDGPADGPAVVLLHGWPQDRSAWDRVIPGLTAQGLRVLAPDLRGYSPGARPRARSAYRMSELVGDVLALLDAAGIDRAHVVGHDWGGALAWSLAQRSPERVATLTVLSTPHPAAMAWAFRHGDQALRSWYMVAFQVPVLPEVVLRWRIDDLLERMGLPPAQVQRYAARFREPGAARGGLNWYRGMAATRAIRRGLAAPRSRAGAGAGESGRRPEAPSGTSRSRRLEVPTTYLWGSRDPALGRAAAERTARCVGDDYRFVEVDAGHWLPEKRPDDVVRAVLERVAP